MHFTRWSILAFQEKSHLCMVYNSYYMNRYKWLYMYIYMLTTSAPASWTLVGWQVARMQHWTTEVFASNYSWLLLLLIHGCCFTQSMTVWLRPASPANLLRPISCLRVSHCTPSFWVSLRLHPPSLSVREPEREANTRSLKMFSSENVLILLLFLSDSLEWKIYRPFLWCFPWHLKLFFPCVPP